MNTLRIESRVMKRSEKLIFIRVAPGSIVGALDEILQSQGYERAAVRAISEDFTPLLAEAGGPLAFVLSPPRDEWVACYSSLAFAAEWELAEGLAAALDRPLIYALFDAERNVYLYRYFDGGDLREEALPETRATTLDEARLIEKLGGHGISMALVDDRRAGFGEEHLVVGYIHRDHGTEGNKGAEHA